MKRSKKKKKRKRPSVKVGRCLNCGEIGAHFVPPSLGEKGFFFCERKIGSTADFDPGINLSTDKFLKALNANVRPE